MPLAVTCSSKTQFGCTCEMASRTREDTQGSTSLRAQQARTALTPGQRHTRTAKVKRGLARRYTMAVIVVTMPMLVHTPTVFEKFSAPNQQRHPQDGHQHHHPHIQGVSESLRFLHVVRVAHLPARDV